MITVSEQQILYFRARRGHLAGPGARTPIEAARAILGAQAQQPGPALLALSQRTKQRPTRAALEALLVETASRSLVRTWGQRETLHIYDPEDWRAIAAARKQWAPAGRRGPMPTTPTLDKALQAIEAAGVATRTDLIGVAPKRYESRLLAENGKYIESMDAARRFAAGRLVWCLSMRGDVCVATKVKSEQAYAARTAWFPDLAWPPLDTREAAVQLTRRYLQVCGPATIKDIAHFFGARVREATTWFEALRQAGELIAVDCGNRRGLYGLDADTQELSRKPSRAASAWPVRLLPQWDTYLMGHADKSWTVPEPSDRKKVWRGQAVVAAAVIDRGRVVAEWKHATKGGKLAVTVIPLSGWKSSTHLPAVRREAAAIAAHLDLAGASVA